MFRLAVAALIAGGFLLLRDGASVVPLVLLAVGLVLLALKRARPGS